MTTHRRTRPPDRLHEPIVDAARHALKAGLQAVLDELPEALTGRDPESVHRLRVATRRARTQLDLFDGCLRKQARQHLRTALSALRHVAGATRDRDVLLARIQGESGVDCLIGHVLADRAAALATMSREAPAVAKQLQQTLNALDSSLRPPHDRQVLTLADRAPSVLRQVLQDLAQACRREPRTAVAMHQVRIRVKRLRYALEALAPVLPTLWHDELLPQMVQLQELLGQANDSATAIAHVQTLMTQLRALPPAVRRRHLPALKPLIAQERSLHSQQAQRFATWWRSWHDRGGDAPYLAALDPSA